MRIGSILLGISAWVLTACQTSGGPAPNKPATTKNVVNGYITNPAQIGFRISQDNVPSKSQFDGQYVVFDLKRSPFEIRTTAADVTIYLAEADLGEFRTFSAGNKVSCLSSVLAGASSPDATDLFISDVTDATSSNNALNTSHGLKSDGGNGYVYVVKSFYKLKSREEVKLTAFAGNLYGYVWIDFNADRKIGTDEVTRIKLSVS